MYRSTRLVTAAVLVLILAGCAKPTGPTKTDVPAQTDPAAPTTVAAPGPAVPASGALDVPALKVSTTLEILREYYAALLAHDYAKALTFWSSKAGQTEESLKIPDGVTNIDVLKDDRIEWSSRQEQHLITLLVTSDSETKGRYRNGRVIQHFIFDVRPEFKILEIK